ncbi:OmpP1/FadL family transporter [Thiomicrospira sp. WB1]|uniref:OmpP1/FadL family transporter n=1 Tax=Thiomicrospira sp. WB1 TaxID=1685380 RepID=UPI000745F494|nr:outer membrane protein transport protein [Thiomicrospira sp. WB1]KUJ72713.1 aromatic hydrocarbon degradation protein [Thiomicrospira sp. WB1]
MKLTRIALAVATTAMVSTPVLATNGDNLIGLGAQSRALGGTGTAAFFGSENALTNPSLLGKGQGTEFAIGGTLFKPDVKAETNVASMPGQTASQTSEADTNIIPEVSLSTRLNDNWTFGLGIFGSAGMGTDYRDNGGEMDGTGLFNGYSNLQLMKFAPSLAYNNENWGIGFAPVIQYGALDINYHSRNNNGTPMDPTDDQVSNFGNGMSSDLGYGFNIGGHFDITPEFTVALAYQSAIDMEYDDQITGAACGFGVGPTGCNARPQTNTITSDNLEQPAEIKIGAAYTMGNMMFTADAKQIKWSDANGYKDFNWDDQNVFGAGFKYTANNYWLGVGYNYAEDPIDVMSDNNPMTAYQNQAVNLFNNHFFPAVVEQHFTFGGGYNITKNLALDAAIVYAAEVNKKVNTGTISDMMSDGSYDGNPVDSTEHEVTHSQIGYTLSLRMNF